MTDQRPRSTLEWALITLILLFAALLRFHDLGNIPKGLEHDEVATWHMVSNVLAGDLVIYFEEGYGHEPLYNYVTALPMALWGHNWLGERFWAPWLGLFAVAATYSLMRRLFGPLVGLSAAGFQATVLWALFFNRLGLRLNLLPFLLCVTVYCFWRGVEAAQLPLDRDTGLGPAVRDPRLRWFARAGALMGLCMYTYMSARVVPLIVGAFTLYLIVRDRWLVATNGDGHPGWAQIWVKWWPALACFAVALLIVAPLMLHLVNRPVTSIPLREGQVDRPLRQLLTGNLGPVLENGWALVKMWNVDGERYWQLNYAHRPVFVEPISGALFWLGLLVALWRWKEPRMALLLLWTALGMVPSLLTSEAPSWPRTMLASPAALTLPGIAIWTAESRLQRREGRWFALVRYGLVVLLALSIAVTGILTYRDYLVVWPAQPRVRYAFQSSLTEALRSLDASEMATPVVAAGLSPHDMDPWTEQSTLRRRDLGIRWVDTRSALLLPHSDVARLVTLDITPVDPALAAWAGLDETSAIERGALVARGGAEADPDAPVYYAPAYIVYALDVPALRSAIASASLAAYAGADPADATPLTLPPTFGGLVRLIGYQWVAEPQAGQLAQLLTFWEALDTGPGAVLYGEPALRIFLHLLDDEQRVVAGVDALGAAPDTWQSGDVIVQLHAFDAPVEPGKYAVEVGWYVPPSGPRLSVDAPSDRVLLDPVEVGK